MGDDFRRAATAGGGRAGWRRSSIRRCARARSACRPVSSTRSAATRRPRRWSRSRGSRRRHRGFYISHIRDEADRTIEAVREAIAIGEKARLPVQITHIKLGTVGVWGKAAEVVGDRRGARASAASTSPPTRIPYLAWQSNLKVLVPNKQWTDPASVKEALDDVGGGQNVQITRLPRVPAVRGQAARRDRARPKASAKWTSTSGSCGRRSRHHRPHDGGSRTCASFLRAAVGDGGQRRRHRQQPSARRRHVSARARPLRARREVADAARGDPQDDLAAGRTAAA